MTDDPRALGDARVVVMGQLLAGPFCGQLLGDFGAEVVKIEPPGSGDPMRIAAAAGRARWPSSWRRRG